MEWQRGFSLIELLVTLAVVAILLTVGVPASQAFIAKSRLTTASNQFTLSLLLARSEAAKRGKDVLMISANGKDWSGGWRVGVDVNGDGDLSDASDEVVRVAAALRGGGIAEIQPGRKIRHFPIRLGNPIGDHECRLQWEKQED